MKNYNRRRNGEPANRARSAGDQEEKRDSQRSSPHRPVLITGGAGFIGTNLAHRLLSAGRSVLVYDNLSRPGVEQNLSWLRRTHGPLLQFQKGDVRDFETLRRAVVQAGQVFHFAAQVAVTTSLEDPIHDFEVNVRGTLNLLEALRSCDRPATLLFTSTNKVYGDLKDVGFHVRQGRYEAGDAAVKRHGFGEDRPLAFHSPYGCSKGAACQYVLDYARTFGLRTAVFRMSCIYGLHQFGNEDQGWVAHFLISALKRAPITIYGDGRQVRDVLFVEDLVDALLKAQANMHRISGEAFNIGGGPANTISLLELLDLVTELEGRRPAVRFEQWRPADQQYYVSDIRKFSEAAGWKPAIDVRVGVTKLYHWLKTYQPEISEALAHAANGTSNGHAAQERASSRIIRSHRLPQPRLSLKCRNGHSRSRRSARRLAGTT